MNVKDYFVTLKNFLFKVHDAELKGELQAALIEARQAALHLQDQVADIQGENAKLKAALAASDEAAALKDTLYYGRNAYWRSDEIECNAYCAVCWDSRRTRVHLTVETFDGSCNQCHCKFPGVYFGPKPIQGEADYPVVAERMAERVRRAIIGYSPTLQ